MAKRVTIQLDKPRGVRFDGVALLRLEELTGMNVVACCRVFQKANVEGKSEEEKAAMAASGFSFRLFAQIAQAGLSGDLPDASTEDVIRMMDENGKGDSAFERILSYTEDVFSALNDSVGDKSKKAKNAKADPEEKE